MQTLGDTEESRQACLDLKLSMKTQSSDLEKLTKILTEVETLKDIQGKAEETYSEDHAVVDALVASIAENEKTLRDNIAALKSRCASLSK